MRAYYVHRHARAGLGGTIDENEVNTAIELALDDIDSRLQGRVVSIAPVTVLNVGGSFSWYTTIVWEAR